jgi:hypothetical protein
MNEATMIRNRSPAKQRRYLSARGVVEAKVAPQDIDQVASAAEAVVHIMCKIWYLISRTVSEDDAHHGNMNDRSARPSKTQRPCR